MRIFFLEVFLDRYMAWLVDENEISICSLCETILVSISMNA